MKKTGKTEEKKPRKTPKEGGRRPSSGLVDFTRALHPDSMTWRVELLNAAVPAENEA